MKRIQKFAKFGIVALALGLPLGASAQGIQTGDCRLNLFYPNGISKITDAQRSAIMSFVKNSGDMTISVVGYASTLGTTQANLVLSRARANKVAAVISKSGYGAAPVGRGEAGPGAESRRVDIVRDDCDAATASASAGAGALAGPLAGGSALLLLLLGDKSSGNTTGSSGTGTN